MTVDKKFKRLVRDRARRTGQSYGRLDVNSSAKRSEEPMTNIEATVRRLPCRGDRRRGASRPTRLDAETDPSGHRRRPGATDRHRLGRGHRHRLALQQVAHSRPMTHDALKDTVDALGHLTRIVIGFHPKPTPSPPTSLFPWPEARTPSRLAGLRTVALAVRCQPPPRIVVPESILASPPATLFQGIDRCRCGEAITIDRDAIKADMHTAGHFEADVVCPACGLRRLMRFGPPHEIARTRREISPLLSREEPPTLRPPGASTNWRFGGPHWAEGRQGCGRLPAVRSTWQRRSSS